MKQTNTILQGKWSSGKNAVRVSVPLIFFVEENTYIAYCPALDISACGITETSAFDAFKESLLAYFEYTVNKHTLLDDLKKYGWTVKKSVRKPMIPPPMSYLLETNNEFSRIFNNYDFKKVDHQLQMPALA